MYGFLRLLVQNTEWKEQWSEAKESGAHRETQKGGRDWKGEAIKMKSFFVKSLTKCPKRGGAKDHRPPPLYAYGVTLLSSQASLHTRALSNYLLKRFYIQELYRIIFSGFSTYTNCTLLSSRASLHTRTLPYYLLKLLYILRLVQRVSEYWLGENRFSG